jgi:two-component system, chemotaxis family, CheB/CheR fusion protein
MPDSAIAAGIVDYVLDPVAIARELVYLSSHNFIKRENMANVATNDLNTIFQLLQKVDGIDFSHYKTPTIRRRINHKMQQSGIRKIQDYIHFVVQRPIDQCNQIFQRPRRVFVPRNAPFPGFSAA